MIRNYKKEWGNIGDKAGSFSDAGTLSFSATTGFDFAPNKGPTAEYYQMQFIPSLYKTTYSPGNNCYVSYSVQPTEETGGNHVKYRIRIPRTTLCSPQPAGAWHKSTTTASTITGGLTVAELGFTASAQTGWSKTDTLTYQNVKGRHGFWLCGAHDYPGGTHPGEIVAGLPG